MTSTSTFAPVIDTDEDLNWLEYSVIDPSDVPSPVSVPEWTVEDAQACASGIHYCDACAMWMYIDSDYMDSCMCC